MVKTRKGEKRKASLDDSSSEPELSPLAEAVRRVSPFVSITPTPPPSRHGGPSPRKRILVEDRLEVRPVASTSSKIVQQHAVPSTSKDVVACLYSDSEDEELALLEQRLMDDIQ